MNQTGYMKSRARLREAIKPCAEDEHDWCAPDPVTQRVYCRVCASYTDRWDGYVKRVYQLGWDVDDPLDGWYPTRRDDWSKKNTI